MPLSTPQPLVLESTKQAATMRSTPSQLWVMLQAAGGGSKSSINKAEANLVAQLVLKLLQAPAPNSRAEGRSQQQQREDDEDMDEGCDCSHAAPRALAAHQLGVICFFRGQAALIKQTMAAGAASVMLAVYIIRKQCMWVHLC
jgi:hypothetical protein